MGYMDLIRLINTGVFCYFNVIAQLLFSIENFRDLVLEAEQDADCINFLQNIFFEMETKKYRKGGIDLSRDYRELCEFADYNPEQQQDLGEIFIFIANKLVEEGIGDVTVDENNYENLPDSVILWSTLTRDFYNCALCEKKDYYDSDFSHIIHLDIKSSIKKSIEFYLESPSMKKVPHECNIMKHYGIENNENYIIRAKMFVYVSEFIIFSLKRYHSGASTSHSAKFIDEQTKMKNDPLNISKDHSVIFIDEQINIENDPFDIYAIITHQGSMTCGHYIIYIRNKAGKYWVKYNDTEITKGNICLNSEEISRTASILVYKRM
ncbi:Peptidase C19 contains ubiquitinyl hydrolase [Spraguea lophii 42_110]|uniref:ubiquitinyl hydrolase 1 n=1 Tax=Spraguea lophii (strain 42_110) TaxID=1358809 RepID=S7W589_SPRLO|nr:Peptidase C19 contains ubiquitinyl hydrolase [Spraguea lophii 42_110]